MERKDRLREIDSENRTCYYFNNIIGVMDRDSDFDFNDFPLNEKLYKER